MRFHLDQEGEEPPNAPDGVVLGRWIDGEEALPVHNSEVIWPFEQMHRHAVIFGDPGSGKTETAMRIAHEFAAKNAGAPVLYLDAAGDPRTEERFLAVMGDAGRRVRVFPDEPFDAWRGDPQAVRARLMEVAGPEEEANPPQSYLERSIAVVALELALRHPDGPPSSSAELLARFDYEWLVAINPSMFGNSRAELDRVRLHFQRFFDQLDGAFDGDWAWDDADAAYIRLDPDELGSRAPSLAQLFLRDWAHYLRERRPPEQASLMLISGLTEDALPAQTLWQVIGPASKLGAAVVTTWDAPADIGPEQQQRILLGGVSTVILHATSRPEGIDHLIGKERAPELETSFRYEQGEYRPEHLLHQRRRPKLGPADIANQPPGTAWIVKSGRVCQVAIEPA